jgi:nicotinamide-nucleotide amidase
VVGDLLRERRATLALAESCTGGLLGKRLTDAPGASDFLIGGFVTYANEAKTGLLSVDPDILRRHGAVSEKTARAMAAGARYALNADWGVSITGVAGPGGGSPEKPVGTVCIAVAGQDVLEVRRLRLIGDRAEIRERAAQAALSLLRLSLAEGRS